MSFFINSKCWLQLCIEQGLVMCAVQGMKVKEQELTWNEQVRAAYIPLKWLETYLSLPHPASACSCLAAVSGWSCACQNCVLGELCLCCVSYNATTVTVIRLFIWKTTETYKHSHATQWQFKDNDVMKTNTSASRTIHQNAADH